MSLRTVSIPVLLVCLGACGGPGARDPEQFQSRSDELTICANGSTVEGIDVSDWQVGVNWTSVKSSGRQFAWIRVSDGLNHIDTEFSTYWPAAKSAGVLRGPYQYFRGSEDPTQQANLLISKVGRLGAGDLPAMLDIEELDGQTASTVISKMWTWLAAVQAGTGKVPVIYTNINTWNYQLGNPQGFTGYPLWAASWGGSCPGMPGNWSAWRTWQYSSTGSVPGISGNVDLDKFNGSLAILNSFAGVGGNCIFGNGLYCGGDGVIGDPRSLYSCSGGVATLKQACASGCTPMPAGSSDQCAPTSSCPLGNGLYCGGDNIGGDYNTLYNCNAGALTVSQTCTRGCKYMPVGQNDQCN